MAMKESTLMVWKFLQDHNGEDLTSGAVAEALGLQKRQVDGSFTRGIQGKKMGYREEAEEEQADGSHIAVKYLRLNAEGLAFNLDEADTLKETKEE